MEWKHAVCILYSISVAWACDVPLAQFPCSVQSCFPQQFSHPFLSSSGPFTCVCLVRPLVRLELGADLFCYLFFYILFLKTFLFSFLLLRKTSGSIHIITLYISMIRAEENYSRLTAVEEIIWRRGKSFCNWTLWVVSSLTDLGLPWTEATGHSAQIGVGGFSRS